MREILFRGQTRRKGECIINFRGDKCESNWVYGGIFPQNKGGSYAIIYQQEPKIEKFTVYADTVGQYTGLTDKDGNKIFEGDILRVAQNEVVAIYYDECYCQFRARETNGRENAIDYYCGYPVKAEIIGNIYDNPELVEVK